MELVELDEEGVQLMQVGLTHNVCAPAGALVIMLLAVSLPFLPLICCALPHHHRVRVRASRERGGG
jgi:hypothetical protein